MIKMLKASRCRYWLRQRGIKLGIAVPDFPRAAVLQLEEGCAISGVQAAFTTLHVGTMTYIRSESELLNVSRIGRFCSIGNSVVIGQEKAGHPLDWVSTHPMQYTGTSLHYIERGEPAEIGHDVWIGREAMIMEGVKVSTGAVIAARSLVTCDVPPYAIVAGTPARIIRYRHSEQVINDLLGSAWWELPVDVLQRLSLDVPEHFLRQFAELPSREPAIYRQVEVSRRGCRELSGGLASGRVGEVQ
ncbi:CatB-related O-acetyltransferase [Pseudomonas berkeleyensis]|uniref:CatB-related O-acetyltransferase n=2 Tax=Pseudomonas berkeleyensis TaxID=2726956 RepID=A0A7G5DQU2_9PSED|nr:CatB-related O-acetyltransferase [Pseudomonas berkeleyensis]